MQIQITGRNNMEITDALRDFTQKKLQSRLERFADKITSTQLIFSVDKLRQVVEAKIAVPGTEIIASAESDDMYKSVDELVDKLVRQLTRHKEKVTDHHRD